MIRLGMEQSFAKLLKCSLTSPKYHAQKLKYDGKYSQGKNIQHSSATKKPIGYFY